MQQGGQSAYEISVMSGDEVQIAMDWARQEGWNPGLADAAAFYAADASGFLLGRLDGVPVATISAVKYGSSFGFIGLYIVQEPYRGQGYGLQIWQAAMAGLQGRNVGLDGVVAQQDNYRKSGFRLAHRNVRFAGKAAAGGWVDGIVPASSLDFATLAAFDRQFFPAQRDSFLRHWISEDNAQALVLQEQGRILAFGCIRACHQGYKIGPLNAQTPELAQAMFSALSARVPVGSDLYLDVPEPNAAALALAERAGMAPVFETARMYTGEFPDIRLAQVFGITSFELG